jgi:hypothetical protein
MAEQADSADYSSRVPRTRSHILEGSPARFENFEPFQDKCNCMIKLLLCFFSTSYKSLTPEQHKRKQPAIATSVPNRTPSPQDYPF